MQQLIKPDKAEWELLSRRPAVPAADLDETVIAIFSDISNNGDDAIKKYSSLFDGVIVDEFLVSADEIAVAVNAVPDELKNAINLAKSNIEKFHISQVEQIKPIETTAGVTCWRESRPIETVGIYIPGGSAPLFSTVLMLGIPAIIAGCSQIVLCSPPNKYGEINPAILYAANLLGIRNIYKVGGIQAIAAMCFGTASIPKVSKIFGPGNQYVTAAKQYSLQFGTAIDMPAGPSEVLIIADETSNPEFVAADLFSQAEHGPDSQVILLSDSEKVIEATLNEIEIQLKELPRKSIIIEALKNSKAIVFDNIQQCIEFSNNYAPEHLILASDKAEEYIDTISSAGSVFLGNYSCESAGDYASGTNHTLPTNGYARNYSGVSIDSFIKKITFQKISRDGIRNIGPAIEIMAAAEQLNAHKNAVSVRLKTIRND